MIRYLEDKPQGKFGVHQYAVGESDETRGKRACFRRYQQYFSVPDEN
jgi:hypothetical protein